MDSEIKRSFQVLELDETASADDAKRAWRQLAKVWHPDRFPNDERLQQRGQEKLKKINEAYELLSNYLANPPPPKPRSQPSQNHQPYAQPQPPKPSAAGSDFQRDSKLELLEATIKTEIEKQFAQNPATRAAYILSFNLTPAAFNLYKGFLAVSINGKSEILTVTLWDGEDRIQWERERLSIEQPKQATPRKSYDDSETILNAPCDFCGSPIDFPESKTGNKEACPNCGNPTFLPYGATVKRRGNPRVQKPFVNQNNSQANNAEKKSGGNKIRDIIFLIIGYLVFAYIALAILGDSFFYKFLLYVVASIVIGVINSIFKSDK